MDSSESVEFLHPDLKTRQAGYAMVGRAERGEHRCVVGLKKQVTGSPKVSNRVASRRARDLYARCEHMLCPTLRRLRQGMD